MLAHFWLFFHRQWKGQLLLLSELYYNNDDRRRSKHDFKIKHFEINWLRNNWTKMSNLLVLFSTWVSHWQTWILLRQLKATQVYTYILVWMVADHNLTPECRQGSLILGQVFIGTNFNFLVPVSTLIFQKSPYFPKIY